MIDKLRHYIEEIESELRFSGRSYPEGIEPFPKILKGQGFFPGGDGLWRDRNKLRERSNCEFPRNGIMFLGNDFGSLTRFQKLKHHENPPTWWLLRRRLDLAGIPGWTGFYTNAYLGLRSDRNALAKPIDEQRYGDLCTDFLRYQISVQKPRLIIVLGERPAALLKKVVSYPEIKKGLIQYGIYNGNNICVLITSHPYSDLRKTQEAIESESNLMSEAWQRLNSPRREV